MCTYNGAAFVREQLESIAQQSRLPNRVVVVDDCSRDNTVDLLYRFAVGALFPIEIAVNETNLGYVKNFEKAVGLLDTDVVVLSDQDDLWAREKLANVERYFLERPNADALFTDAELVDRDGRPYGYSLWESLEFSAREQRWVEQGNAIKVLLRRNVVTGATMAFRDRVKPRVLPIPKEWVHDEWMSIIIAATGRLGLIHEKLIQYRQHGGNQIGARRLSIPEKFRLLFTKRMDFHPKLYEKTRLLRQHLASPVAGPVGDNVLAELDRKLEHLTVRGRLPSTRLLRVGSILRELARGRYFRYSSGWRSVLRDLFEPF